MQILPPEAFGANGGCLRRGYLDQDETVQGARSFAVPRSKPQNTNPASNPKAKQYGRAKIRRYLYGRGKGKGKIGRCGHPFAIARLTPVANAASTTSAGFAINTSEKTAIIGRTSIANANTAAAAFRHSGNKTPANMSATMPRGIREIARPSGRIALVAVISRPANNNAPTACKDHRHPVPPTYAIRPKRIGKAHRQNSKHSLRRRCRYSRRQHKRNRAAVTHKRCAERGRDQ